MRNIFFISCFGLTLCHLGAAQKKTVPVPKKDATACVGLTVDGALIYGNAKIDGLEFANKAHLVPTEGGAHINVGVKPTLLPFDSWDPGFQVGLGYVFSEDRLWQTRLSWSGLRTDTSHSAKTDVNRLATDPMFPLWLPFLTGIYVTQAKAHWALDFFLLDLDLSRQFSVGKWLSLTPLLGVRGAWIDQHYRVRYETVIVDTVTTTPTSFRTKQDFDGVGIKLGSDFQFNMSRSWSILGNLTGSLLWGKVKLDERIKGAVVIFQALSETVDYKKKFEEIRPNLEGKLGVQWQLFYNEDRFRVACSASYFFAYWFRQGSVMDQILVPVNDGQPLVSEIVKVGDLQLQGVNIKLEFDF